MTTLHLGDDNLRMVIAALRYFARNEAGQTQAPNLCVETDYQEWDLAEKLEATLQRSLKSRARHYQP